MKLGIIGLPGAGKTTIFNALTRGDAPTGQSMSGRFDVLTAVVDVPDERVDILVPMFNPQKTAYARVIYNDIAGLKKGIGESGGMSGPLLNHLAALDGFVHVVRTFESELFPHPDGSIDPVRDLETLDAEFLINDLVVVEGKLERIATGLGRGSIRDKGTAMREQALFERLGECLNAEKPLRDMVDELTDDEEKSLRGYGFLTIKPVLVLLNIGDEQDEFALDYGHAHSRVVNLRGRLEMELAQLSGPDGDPEGLEMFMDEYGVTELGLDRVIRESYELMGLQSFFTVGEDEVRAWTLVRGATALDAAGTIHSDLAKGFIRAETVAYTDLIDAGSMAAARAVGKFRQEGKTYVMQDGDIVNIKFNL
jgi:GTP-binding protein YchF